MHVFTYLFLSLLEQSFPVLLAERILSVEESMFSKMATVCVCVCVCVCVLEGGRVRLGASGLFMEILKTLFRVLRGIQTGSQKLKPVFSNIIRKCPWDKCYFYTKIPTYLFK